MTEYIERAAARNAVKRVIGDQDHTCKAMMDFYVALNEVPAADVMEVRHGRWEMAPCNGVYDMRCSACGFCPGIRFFSSNYCPDCGAHMEKEADHD